MQIYIHRNNQQLGPFTEAEIKAQLASGAISPQDHVWWQGQATWIPLSQSQLATAVPLGTPGAIAPGIAPIPGTEKTSNLALWSLVCGCLSLICGIFTAIPAVILGHMGRAEIKKQPGLKGDGMALAGLIIGYVMLTLVGVSLVAMGILMALGNQVQDTFKTINAQVQSAQTQGTSDKSDSDQSTNSPDQSTNSTDQPSATPVTNSADSSTNSAPATNQ